MSTLKTARISTWLPAAGLALVVTLTGAVAATAADNTPAADKAPAAGDKAAAASGAKVVGPPEVAWKDMTPEQKGKFMKAVVTPKMKPMFQAYDPVAFKEFNCSTCHGKDGKSRKFKMPSNDIKPLPGTPEDFKAKLAKEPTWPKWAKFMSEQVTPQVATLLGLPKFDHNKPEAGGFSCQGCHKIEGKTETK